MSTGTYYQFDHYQKIIIDHEFQKRTVEYINFYGASTVMTKFYGFVLIWASLIDEMPKVSYQAWKERTSLQKPVRSISFAKP